MTGRYLTDMADVLRAAGLGNVNEYSGWQTRARGSGGYASGRPWCVMWHHTASSGSAKSAADYCTVQNPDAPVANIVLGSDAEIWVCAAGAVNTNGKGGPVTVSRGTVPVDSMNTYAIGIEAVNSGVGQSWPQAQIDAYFAISNALTAAYGLAPTDLGTHTWWAPGRKIDPATAAAVQGPWRPRSINSSGSWNVDDVRAEAARRASSTPTPTPPPNGDNDMTDDQAQQLAEVHRWITQAIEPSMFTDPGGNPMSMPWGIGWTWSLLQTVSQQVADLTARVDALGG